MNYRTTYFQDLELIEYKKAWDYQEELFNENTEIDIITLSDKLKNKGQIDAVGGSAFINILSDVVMSGANLEYHIKFKKDSVVSGGLTSDVRCNSLKLIKYYNEVPLSEIKLISPQLLNYRFLRVNHQK